jgi:hypothetical protein
MAVPKPILGVLFISFGVLALEDIQNYLASQSFDGGRRGCDRMVVGFITIYATSAYHH